MNREEMMRKIPHRDGMLLLDSVTCQNGEAVGIKQILPDEPLLLTVQGKKVYPSFLFPELMAQTALFTADCEGKIPLLLGIRNFSANDYAFSGECLRVTAVSAYFSGSAGQADCRILCEDRMIAEGKILYCLKEGISI